MANPHRRSRLYRLNEIARIFEDPPMILATFVCTTPFCRSQGSISFDMHGNVISRIDEANYNHRITVFLENPLVEFSDQVLQNWLFSGIFKIKKHRTCSQCAETMREVNRTIRCPICREPTLRVLQLRP